MKIALVYNDLIPNSTGRYVYEELINLGYCVNVINPVKVIYKENDEYDLLLAIDYGCKFDIPKDISFKKSAIWLIDTHLHFLRYFFMALKYNYIYCTQKRGAEKFNKIGLCALWLPLAYSPKYHVSNQSLKKYDIAFIGNPTWGIRQKVLNKISSTIKNSYVGNCDFRRIGEVYSSSYLVFNISINDDLNMRYFEGIASGSFVQTDVVYGINEIIGFDERYSYDRASLSCLDEFIANLRKTIDDIKQKKIIIDEHKLKLFLSKNSYSHRVQELLCDVSNAKGISGLRYSYLKFIIYIFFPEIMNGFTIFIIRKFEGLKNKLKKI